VIDSDSEIPVKLLFVRLCVGMFILCAELLTAGFTGYWQNSVPPELHMQTS